MQTRSYRLLGMVQEHAPNGEAQARCARFYNMESADGATEEQLERSWAETLATGLRTGNWPWNV